MGKKITKPPQKTPRVWQNITKIYFPCLGGKKKKSIFVGKDGLDWQIRPDLECRFCNVCSIWTSHPETALNSPQVWQSWAAWSKKFVRPSRSYAEQIFCETCPRLANPARVGVRFLDVMSICVKKCIFCEVE